MISTVISFIGIVLAFAWAEDKRCEAYFIMLYLRATFWVITFVSVNTTIPNNNFISKYIHHLIIGSCSII